MDFKVLNWNIGGAKFLEQKKRSAREGVRKELNSALKKIIREYGPDVVTLQEIVRYKEPKDSGIVDLIDDIPNYNYYSFPLIDSLLFSSQAKWNKVKEGSDWDPHTYFAQGNAFLFRQNAPLFPVWDLSDLRESSPGRQRIEFLRQFEQHTSANDAILLAAQQMAIRDPRNLIEHVHLDSGLYFGDRDTEPRAALVAHLIIDSLGTKSHQLEKRSPEDQLPLDIFIVNIHLVTIMMEREGIPNIDAKAVHMRKTQLDTIFDGIVSRYNSWMVNRYPQRRTARQPESWETFSRRKPVWILCGDFNFTEDSEEYEYIRRKNFIDTTPEIGRHSIHGTGTKTSGPGNPPTLTLDYIFAGPKFIAFNHVFHEAGINNNHVNHKYRVSDHYPVFSSLPLILTQGAQSRKK